MPADAAREPPAIHLVRSGRMVELIASGRDARLQSGSPPGRSAVGGCAVRSFRLRKIMKTVALPPEINATSAMIHLRPNTATKPGPNTAKRVNMIKSHPNAPTKVTAKKRLVGYLMRPDTTSKAVRVPRTSRPKIRANPPNRVNQPEAKSTFSLETSARPHLESSALAPPVLTSK